MRHKTPAMRSASPPRTGEGPGEGSVSPRPSRKRACPEPRHRGAPRGNLNALKTGRTSRQLKAVIEKLTRDAELRPLLQLVRARRRPPAEDQPS